jgi:hypothetical protein
MAAAATDETTAAQAPADGATAVQEGVAQANSTAGFEGSTASEVEENATDEVFYDGSERSIINYSLEYINLSNHLPKIDYSSNWGGYGLDNAAWVMEQAGARGPPW